MLATWQHVMPNRHGERLRAACYVSFRRGGLLNYVVEVERFEALDFFMDSRIQRVRRLVGHMEALNEDQGEDLAGHP